MLTAGSRRSSGRALNIFGPATANGRRPNVLRRCRGTVSWWRAVEHRCQRVATWATGMQQFDRYNCALPSRHRWVSMPSLYFTRSGMSSQCNSWCISRDRPWSNFLVSLTTRAAYTQLKSRKTNGCQKTENVLLSSESISRIELNALVCMKSTVSGI